SVSLQSSADEMVEVVLRPTTLLHTWQFGSLHGLERPQIKTLAAEELHDRIALVGPCVADVFDLGCGCWNGGGRGRGPRRAFFYPAFEHGDVLTGQLLLRRHFKNFVRALYCH